MCCQVFVIGVDWNVVFCYYNFIGDDGWVIVYVYFEDLCFSKEIIVNGVGG